MKFDIKPVKKDLKDAIQHKIDTKTKPLGALGILEELALQIAMIQETLSPRLSEPVILVFAGDHGIASTGKVNPYPQEVTAQMVYNFLNGGAAINVFCKQHTIGLKIIDAGVNHTFETSPNLIDAKIALGTENYEHGAAMSIPQCKMALDKGAALVQKCYDEGSTIIGFGEMGIGNSSSASLLMAAFTKIPIADCVGAGTGLVGAGVSQKTKVLTTVFNTHQPQSALETLATFGGFEIAMIAGGMLQAAQLGMIILIDGFIVTAALLAAHAMCDNVLDYCVFSHTSDEQGHQKMLAFLEKKAVLNLNMRLGEGTGVAMAYPVIESAVAFLNEMASFEEAGVDEVM